MLRAVKDICVWIDIFAINQHPGREQVDDLAHLQEVIKHSESTLMILDNTGQVRRGRKDERRLGMGNDSV